VFAPQGIVTESCFEHFMYLQCSFPEFQAKLNADSLFLKIGHYKITHRT